MTLLNVDASIPSAMWPVVRLLEPTTAALPRDTLLSLLSPPSLFADRAEDSQKTADRAIASLRGVGLVELDGEHFILASKMADNHPLDTTMFLNLLRTACLDPSRNEDLMGSSDRGPLDLVRGLIWFLTLDPLERPVGWEEVQSLQASVDWEAGRPFENGTRWARFFYWATALGFASRHPLLDKRRQALVLVPDCTVAVRETVGHLWPVGTRLTAAELIEGLSETLPVLPEGAYAKRMGMAAAPGMLSPSLSHALLSGDEQGWIVLSRRADSQSDIALVDRDRVDGVRRVTDVEVHGGRDA